MSDLSLLTLLDEVRHKTRSLLSGVTEQQSRWAPPGLQNTILWHAGHAYVVTEWLIMRGLGLTPQAPPGWWEMFGWDSRPADVPADRWPRLATVLEQLATQHVRLREILATLSSDELTAPAPERPDKTVRFFIVHALHDEACHSGEVWLLRKMLLHGSSTHSGAAK
jgi:hypothetical protein